MAKTSYALNVLKRYGEVYRGPDNKYSLTIGKKTISFYDQDGRVVAIKVSDINYPDRAEVDLFYSYYPDNIKQAISYAGWKLTFICPWCREEKPNNVQCSKGYCRSCSQFDI